MDERILEKKLKEALTKATKALAELPELNDKEVQELSSNGLPDQILIYSAYRLAVSSHDILMIALGHVDE